MQTNLYGVCIAGLIVVLSGLPSEGWATVAPYVADLGSAKQFTVLIPGNSKGSSELDLHGHASIVGDVAVGSNVELATSGKTNSIDGNLFTFASVDVPGDVLGGAQVQSPEMVNKAISDAIAFSQTIADFTATQTFTTINANATITGNGGVNVIDFVGRGVDLDKNDVLTLSGNADDIFYINFLNSANFSVSGAAQIALAGGVNPNNIYWNLTNGQEASITGGTTYGTILNDVGSAGADFVIKNAALYGRIIGGGGSVSIVNGSVVQGPVVEQAPEVRSMAMVAIFGLLTLVSTLRRFLAKPTPGAA